MNEQRKNTTFSLSQSVRDDLEARVAVNERSQFVEQAIVEALLQDARRRAIDAISAFSPVETHGLDSVEVLRGIRSERASYVADRHKSD